MIRLLQNESFHCVALVDKYRQLSPIVKRAPIVFLSRVVEESTYYPAATCLRNFK